MKNERYFLCPAIWFSGFLGCGAFVHLVRLLFRLPLTVGSFEVPLGFSALIVVFFGILSGALLYLGCKKPCCSGSQEGEP